MSSNWEHIEELFHATLALETADRSGYLRDQCSSDGELRSEVESLLAAFENSNGFIEEPAVNLAFEVLQTTDYETLAGQTIGPYKILKRLGKGGMGEVYLAEDTRLGRQVALKFLTPAFIDDLWAKEYLINEAKAVAMLDHPNICAVYGIEHLDEHNFIVMQYVEGETLADLIRSGLTIDQILPLARQIASALAEAHTHGIIHRDIKPRNIMVTPSGQVKVLDFGLAKTIMNQAHLSAAESISYLSQAGLVPGTVAYMSPEQLRSEQLDFSSDVFSVGIVLYEMITGANPYARETTAEIISAILTEPAPAFTHLKISPNLSRLVRRCLEKKKEARQQSASELLESLNHVGPITHREILWQRVVKLRFALAAVVMLGLLVAGFWLVSHRWGRVQTIAVLPVVNESGDSRFDYLEDALAESLITKLSRLPRLRVDAVGNVMAYRGRSVEAEIAGRELGVDVVLVERIVKENQGILLNVGLVTTANGSRIWNEQFDIQNSTISDLRAQISAKVAENLKLPLGARDEQLLTTRDTQNEEAFLEYLRARHYWNNRTRENIEKAVDRFKAAIDLDPAFARAHAGLADCYVLMNTPAYGDMPSDQAMALARSESNRALEIDSTLPDAHTALGLVYLKYDWKWNEAEREFKEAIRLDPDYAPAHYWYANLLTVLLRQNEAILQSGEAMRLDTSSLANRANFCRQYYYSRQYDKAVACASEMLKNDPESVAAKYLLGYAYVREGLADKSIEVFQGLPENNRALKLVALGYAYCQANRRAECLKSFSDVKEMMSHNNTLPPSEMAVMYLGMGDGKSALEWLERAYEERSASLIYVSVEPGYDSLRNDQKFMDLTKRMNLPLPTALSSPTNQ